MSGFDIVAEGPLTTARLVLHHIHTRPLGAVMGRVLLLGGSNFDLSLKRDFLRAPLLNRFELATYEPRGIGRSPHGTDPVSMADFAEDALACLDALGWDRAHVVGESFGGMTALHLALAAPGRIDRLVIASGTAGGALGGSFDIGVFLDMPPHMAAAAALALQDNRWAAVQDRDRAAYQAALTARQAFEAAFQPSVASGGYAALLAARRLHDVSAALPTIMAPTLVCAGLRDRQAPPEAQRRMADLLPRGRFLAFEAGHGLLFSEPAVMAAVLQHLGGEQTP
ncbi:MAG: alpha/beta fold hydrolase [Pseudomonadota bacterium]